MRFFLKVFTLFGVMISYSQCDTAENITFSVTTILETPYVMLRNDTTVTGNARFEGYIIDLVDQIAKRLYFQYEVRLVADAEYGSFINGEWNGIVGEVLNGVTDIGVGPFPITSEREKVVDFTYPFLTGGISIIYNRPSEGEAIPFTNVKELAALNTTKFGFKQYSETHQFFKESDNPIYKRIYERITSEGFSTLTPTIADGIKRVKAEDYAFFMESTTIDYYGERDCDLLQIGGLLDFKGYGLAVQKGSPYRSVLSQAILSLQESGVLARLQTKWWKKDGVECYD